MKKIVFDLDEIMDLAISENVDAIAELSGMITEYREDKYSIVLVSALSSFRKESSGTPFGPFSSFVEVLCSCSIQYDELILGKPEVSRATLIIDDKVVTFDEFKNFDKEQILRILEREASEVE